MSNNEIQDLFETPELIPANVREVLDRFSEEYENGPDYQLNERVLAELKPLGYTFEYGLDADPYNLHKIN